MHNCTGKIGSLACNFTQLVLAHTNGRYIDSKDDSDNIVLYYICFHSYKVAIYKRAQILVGDIWACFGGTSYGSFKDIDEITAFADYRIPQALVWFGAIAYSDDLQELLKKGMFSFKF